MSTTGPGDGNRAPRIANAIAIATAAAAAIPPTTSIRRMVDAYLERSPLGERLARATIAAEVRAVKTFAPAKRSETAGRCRRRSRRLGAMGGAARRVRRRGGDPHRACDRPVASADRADAEARFVRVRLVGAANRRRRFRLAARGAAWTRLSVLSGGPSGALRLAACRARRPGDRLRRDRGARRRRRTDARRRSRGTAGGTDVCRVWTRSLDRDVVRRRKS